MELKILINQEVGSSKNQAVNELRKLVH